MTIKTSLEGMTIKTLPKHDIEPVLAKLEHAYQ